MATCCFTGKRPEEADLLIAYLVEYPKCLPGQLNHDPTPLRPQVGPGLWGKLHIAFLSRPQDQQLAVFLEYEFRLVLRCEMRCAVELLLAFHDIISDSNYNIMSIGLPFDCDVAKRRGIGSHHCLLRYDGGAQRQG